MSTTYVERVAMGAALLDREVPGWERAINLDTLDIEDEETCVLGQLYGHYSTGWAELDLGDYAHEHGLDIRRGEPYEVYETLTALWRELIATRLAVPQPPKLALVA